MRSDYKKIEEVAENFQHYLTYTGNESSVAVYLNGKRLFLNIDYSITERMVTLNVPVKPGDLFILSHS
ncbi:hypothetical protein LY11_04583 [Pedobacter cryoconitis]|uniref:Uncharacterized protein n=1 Tax=Pedobacter cryoconitis TaxID=188932 RepID=A0A327S1K6_9SPHI|nr:hypothetical protein LY11_04583 [Pedobacter cryoconitis]